MDDTRISRKRRHVRVRKKVRGLTARPRISVFKSSKHIYAQIIDDEKGITLVSSSTLEKEIMDNFKHGGNRDAAKKVGELLARRALEKGVRQVVFDRSGYPYHGRLSALADSAREVGLEF